MFTQLVSDYCRYEVRFMLAETTRWTKGTIWDPGLDLLRDWSDMVFHDVLFQFTKKQGRCGWLIDWLCWLIDVYLLVILNLLIDCMVRRLIFQQVGSATMSGCVDKVGVYWSSLPVPWCFEGDEMDEILQGPRPLQSFSMEWHGVIHELKNG